MNKSIQKEAIPTEKPAEIQLGKYQHYKTKKLYEVIGFARNSETYEEMVIYKALYHCEKFGNNHIWARPKNMFLENIEQNGIITPRFKFIKPTDLE